MKSKASAVKTGHFVLPRISALSLALSMACGAMGAQAAVDTSSWVSTKTDAFLPLVQTQDSVGTAVTANAIAVDVQQGTQTRVVVGLQLQNESQLDSFLAALHSGHAKKLTSAQFTAQYAPTQAQVDVVVTHLQKSGFKNISVAPNRLLITADGTAATVKQAFNTSKEFYASRP